MDDADSRLTEIAERLEKFDFWTDIDDDVRWLLDEVKGLRAAMRQSLRTVGGWRVIEKALGDVEPLRDDVVIVCRREVAQFVLDFIRGEGDDNVDAMGEFDDDLYEALEGSSSFDAAASLEGETE